MSQSQTTSSSSSAPPAVQLVRGVPERTAALLHCWLLIALGLLIVAAAAVDFRLAQEFEFLRTNCLVAEIVAGCGAAFSFGGAMHYLDVALATQTIWDPIAWYWKGMFLLQKRVLMLLQLAMMVVALAAVGALVLDWKIPGPDRSVLYRRWVPPGTEP